MYLLKSCDTGYLTDAGQIVFANNSSMKKGSIEIHNKNVFLPFDLSAAPTRFKQTASIICSTVDSRSLYLIMISAVLSLLPHLGKTGS